MDPVTRAIVERDNARADAVLERARRTDADTRALLAWSRRRRDAVARALGYRDAAALDATEPLPDDPRDGFTGAECDVDALTAARAAGVGGVVRPVHRTRRARGDRDE
jgi:hypothetical protein